jgi:transposase
MGGKAGSGRAQRVPAGGQLPLGLDVAEVAAADAARNAAVVQFLDPSPEAIFVGATTLRQFIELRGMGWLQDMRMLLRDLDWSSYVARYKPGGREPYHPASIVGLLLLGHMTGRTSLRQMEDLACTDLRAWWLTGGVMPDYSSLCRFILRHSADLTEATFEQLTRSVLTVLGKKATAVFIDGTVVQAAASRWRLLKQEAARQASEQASAEAAAHPDDQSLERKADRAREAVQAVEQRNRERKAKGRPEEAQVAAAEPEAMVQRLKEGGCAPSYKPSAAATQDRIIVGKQVEASNEVVQVQPVVEQAERIAGAPLESMALDAGYHCAELFAVAQSKGIELLCPEGKSSSKASAWVKRSPRKTKIEFTYDPVADCYVCPEQRRLVREYSCTPGDGKPAYVRYKSQNCEKCPVSSQCKRADAETRTLRRYAHEAAREALLAKMSTPEARARYRQRQASIEPVHGEQKHIQGMRRFRRRGLHKVRLEYSLHCMAHNLRRFRALLAASRAGGGGETGGGGRGRGDGGNRRSGSADTPRFDGQRPQRRRTARGPRFHYRSQPSSTSRRRQLWTAGIAWQQPQAVSFASAFATPSQRERGRPAGRG